MNDTTEKNITENQAAEAEYGEQVAVRREKLKNLCAAGESPYEQTKFDCTATSAEILGNVAEYEGKTVSVAGRVLSRRMMGKASFAHVLDAKGQIQIYVKIDNVGAETYEKWKKADVGDIFGVTGTVFVTHKGDGTSFEVASAASREIPRS